MIQKNREIITIDGKPMRLAEVAEEFPQVLMARILGQEYVKGSDYHDRAPAYWAALNKAGWKRQDILDICPDMGLDAGVLGHITK